jgi:hypothetical protein
MPTYDPPEADALWADAERDPLFAPNLPDPTINPDPIDLGVDANAARRHQLEDAAEDAAREAALEEAVASAKAARPVRDLGVDEAVALAQAALAGAEDATGEAEPGREEPWHIILTEEDRAAIAQQVAAALAPLFAPKALTASLHLSRKVSDHDYGGVEVGHNVMGITAATTDAEIEDLITGPTALAWRKLTEQTNAKVREQIALKFGL